MKPPRRLTHTVAEEEAGRKVSSLLRYSMGLSGTVLRRVKWLPDGILLDGVRVTTRTTASPGQVLSVLVGDAEVKSGILPAVGPLNIIYEDDDFLVINKAPGVPVHPGPGHYDDTLGNFLMKYYETSGILADFHPIHRLDKGTSGLMTVAKYPHAQEKLKNQLHTGAFRRTYLAVCTRTPQPPDGTVDAPIGRVDGSLIAQQVQQDGKRAVTHYRTLSTAPGASLIELTLDTGRTHQIRVHMAHLGCPLVGDFLYGTEERERIARPALHSWKLSLRHPVTEKELSFTAPLPQDMAALLEISAEK